MRRFAAPWWPKRVQLRNTQPNKPFNPIINFHTQHATIVRSPPHQCTQLPPSGPGGSACTWWYHLQSAARGTSTRREERCAEALTMRADPSAGRDGRGGVVLFRGLLGAVASLFTPAWHPTVAVSTLGQLADGSVAAGGAAAGGAAGGATEKTGGGGAAASWPWTVQQAACWRVRVACSSHACSCACCCACCACCACCCASSSRASHSSSVLDSSALASPCSCALISRISSRAVSTQPPAAESKARPTAASTAASTAVCRAAWSSPAPLGTGAGAGTDTGGGGEGGRSCVVSERCTRLSRLASWPSSAVLSGEAARARCSAWLGARLGFGLGLGPGFGLGLGLGVRVGGAPRARAAGIGARR